MRANLGGRSAERSGGGGHRSDLFSVIEFDLADHLWQLILAVESAQELWAAWMSLNTMMVAVSCDKQPLDINLTL